MKKKKDGYEAQNAAFDFIRKPKLNSDFTLKESLTPLDLLWRVNNQLGLKSRLNFMTIFNKLRAVSIILCSASIKIESDLPLGNLLTIFKKWGCGPYYIFWLSTFYQAFHFFFLGYFFSCFYFLCKLNLLTFNSFIFILLNVGHPLSQVQSLKKLKVYFSDVRQRKGGNLKTCAC